MATQCVAPTYGPCPCPAVAKTLVTMEQSYVTAAFFRHRTRERWNQIKIQQMEQGLVEGGLQTSA